MITTCPGNGPAIHGTPREDVKRATRRRDMPSDFPERPSRSAGRAMELPEVANEPPETM
ncbi:MAG: hypothetical protein LBD64_00315 [Odoribacteraceae bacterium]|nr:hypothetical protein [Odoribacteraceae bacterium]